MTNPDQPSAPPTLTLVEKLYAVHNINTLVPEKLDLAESNYSTWSYFFKGHCSNFGVLKHIEGSSTQSSTSTPPTDDWITADSITKTHGTPLKQSFKTKKGHAWFALKRRATYVSEMGRPNACWGAILNYEERFRDAESKRRHFFPIGCITQSNYPGKKYDQEQFR
ncbi:hypothetical protein Tco_0090809 [Tanacetum coccineum]